MRVKLKEIAGIAAGQGAPQGENAYGNAGVPFIKAGHLSDLLLGINENDLPKVTNEVAQKYHLKLYPAGSIVFAKSGMSCMKGYVYQLRSCCYVVSHLAVITPKKKTYGDYLCHYFTFCRPNTLIKDTAYPSISLSDISNLEIKLYPDAFQTQITKTLDTIKQLVFIRQQQLSKLDQLAKSRFIEMFGDPGSGESKWEKGNLGDYIEIIGGYAFKSEFFADNGIPVLRIGNINTGEFVNKNMVFWQEDVALSRYLVFPGDMVISLTGTVGKDDYGNICIVNDAFPRYYLNQRNAKLCIKKSFSVCFIAELMRFPIIKQQLTNINRGVRQANIANKDIAKLVIPIPPLSLQNEFAAFVEQLDKSKVTIRKSIEKLETTYRALLQDYFEIS